MSDPTFTITHLLTAFRRALQAMAPIAQEVGLTGRDGEAYDQWEALEEDLFDVLVVSAIAGDPDITPDGRVLGRYGSWALPVGLTPRPGDPHRAGLADRAARVLTWSTALGEPTAKAPNSISKAKHFHFAFIR